MLRSLISSVFFTLLLTGACAHPAPPKDAPAVTPAPPETPVIVGDFWRVVKNPDLGVYTDQKAQPVDFAVWQAADGMWQLVSCVRHTKFPGGSRLLFRWETDQLTNPDWQERGIFMTSDDHPEHEQGTVQAPHVIRNGNEFLMYYNSAGAAFVMRSTDGKTFERVNTPDGQVRHFSMGRDVMVFDNRARDKKLYAYYTAITPPLYPTRNNHTIGVRLATDFVGPWSEPIDIGVNTADNNDPKEFPYNFINAESPFVLFRKGYYYRWEQMKVFASRDPLTWANPEVTTMTAEHPRAFYAPEVVEDNGTYYVAGYKYRDALQGIYMARFDWR
jgi:hypothetical protein